VRVILNIFNKRKKTPFILLLIFTIIIITTFSGCSSGALTRGWSGVVPASGSLYLGGMDGKIYAVNPANGTIVWATELEPLPAGGWFSPTSFAAIYSTPASDGKMVFAGSYLLTGSAEHGRIFGLNAENGTVVWTYPARGTLGATVIGSIAVANGLVYAGATDHKIYALNAATGEKKWEFTTGDQIWAGPVVQNGVVYAGSFDKTLYALDATTGLEKWHFETDGAIVAPVLVFNNIVYVGSYNRHFYALDAANGSVKWDLNAGNGFWATPAIAANALYIPCLDGKVYIVELGTGRDLGTANLGSYLSATPAVVGDSVIVATPEGSLFLLNTQNYNAPAFIDLKSTVFADLASANDTIYVHTWAPERLYALDTTGKAKWNSLDLQKK
jgi:outer membrane protein assembly factor BamB